MGGQVERAGKVRADLGEEFAELRFAVAQVASEQRVLDPLGGAGGAGVQEDQFVVHGTGR
ncbi:hypothetical protein [Actinomadura oligospora]|uniref:hypothetical protein n=1 Tax=Actinomadura oligospora TaxID=111804 RepID=UPI00047A9E7F|nr:hypothetical protein [Actinomadura oligospora]